MQNNKRNNNFSTQATTPSPHPYSYTYSSWIFALTIPPKLFCSRLINNNDLTSPNLPHVAYKQHVKVNPLSLKDFLHFV